MKEIFSGTKEIHKNLKTNQIDYILFSDDNMILLKDLPEWLLRSFNLGDNVGITEINRNTDRLSQTHIRYKLTIDNYNVHDAMIIAHIKNNKVFAINGIIQQGAQGSYNKSITESNALQKAKDRVNAEIYKW